MTYDPNRDAEEAVWLKERMAVDKDCEIERLQALLKPPVDGAHEVLTISMAEPCALAELERLAVFPTGSQVLTFAADKIQVNGRLCDVSAISVTREAGTQKRLLMLSVSAPKCSESPSLNEIPKQQTS